MDNYKVYPYRWVILLSIIPVLAVTQVFWLTFAPITVEATSYYHVSPLSIAFLSMSYMIIYILVTLPASWFVDTKGFRVAMGIGAVVTAVFGMARGLYASNFAVVTAAQIGVAIGQPFLMNSITKIAARWFPVNERATASGIAFMAGYIGMIIAMVLTPLLASQYGIEKMLMMYGYAAVACALIFLVLSRERPATSPGPGEELVNKLNFGDVKQVIINKDFKYLMIAIFVGLGIFNAVMTWIEDILKPRGISPDQAGLIGGIIVVVGLIGSIILPVLSDKARKRRPFLVWAFLAAIPGFAGMIFFANYPLILISAAWMGFCIMGMGPIAFQYGAEIAYPVPEGTSYGLLMLMGQISGILFIYGMDALRSPVSGAMTTSLVILLFLMLATFFIVVRLKESELITGVQ